MSHNSCTTRRSRISYLDCLFDVEFCCEFRHESLVLTQRKMLSTSNWKIMIMESVLSSGQFLCVSCVLAQDWENPWLFTVKHYICHFQFCHPEFFILIIYIFLRKHTVIIHVTYCAFYSWLSCRLHHIVFK